MKGLRLLAPLLAATAAAGCVKTVIEPVELSLDMVAGDGQSGVPQTELPDELVVQVLLGGQPKVGSAVTWAMVEGDGSVTAVEAETDAGGHARARYTPGVLGGTHRIRAALASGEQQVFTASIAPTLVATIPIPPNYGIHDTFVRDGLAFVSAWNTGVIILDVGNGIAGGSPSAPVEISRFVPSGGAITGRIHNAWWFHNPNTGEKRYLFLGQEGPGSIGVSSSGDIFALDVSNLAAPVQVGRYTLADAGAHNFWMDEDAEVLFAAYYSGGVVALDVSGELPQDLATRELSRVEPESTTYVWGVMLHQGSLYAADMIHGFYQLRFEGSELSVVAGGGNVPERYTSDLWVHGNAAYTGTWGLRQQQGNALKVWQLDESGAPTLANTVVVPNIGTVSDVEVSAGGSLLMFSAENGSGAGIYWYLLDDPLLPTLRARVPVANGIHTATFGEIGGRRYAFAARNPPNPALLIYDVTDLVP